MPKLQKKISVVDSMAEIFFRPKIYLLGYGKIDFEGILGVPFFYGYSDSSALCLATYIKI